ncbi:ROK family transcriptional regulator [Novosphingobium album (ex Liu et al. 2023)]|uniref:ROK family transcriptional regulator n=1 Tax=Novosphingobium album (ex Liu et al. 2023) TaxID=3031130 RepID=A0ABT5WKZ1_9SPHN|nr:ROK family transcriptional regulator [Novosphingobium album (ex Liu et al. 2023)]MDE8650706.1 ROK family transcriptional regulator [Novosphingobium album (ex Liu et al. 2023)]
MAKSVLQSVQAQFPSLSRSERRLLGLVFRRGEMIQAALAEELELTQQSVSRIVGGLIERNLLRFGKQLSMGKRGYPTTTVELVPDFASAAGVAIMANGLAFAVVDFAGRVQVERKVALDSMTVDAVMDWVNKTLAEVSASGIVPQSGVVGLGVSVAGSFTGEGPGFNTPHYLDHWANIAVTSLFTERVGLPAWVDNDGNTAALAESVIGVGRWANSFGYLNIGAGVGGGIILDGEPWRGRFGNAGEFAGGLPPNIYPFPNLELLRQLVGRGGQVFDTVRELVEHYDPAWPAIDDWIARVRDSVSIIASNATAILDLEAIVFGGLMPKDLTERLIPRVELFDQKRRAQLRPTAKLVPTEIEGYAGAIGGAMLPLRATFFR